MNSDQAQGVSPAPPAPVFIMGCPRTGTTLVSQILDAHSRIAVCHETHFYGIFRPELRRYGDLRRRSSLDHLINDFREVISTQGVAQPPSIEQIHDELAEPTFQGVLTAFLQAHARRQGKARGGDKTPGHYRYLPEILDRHASSPVIFLLRDPRDVVLSIYKAFGGSIKTSSLMWNSALSSYEGVSRPVHLVRYEDLVQKPAETVQTICAFLGEQYEPAMLQYADRVPDRLRALSTAARLVGPVDPGSIGNFHEMPIDEIEQIEDICAVGMRKMDYPFVNPRRKPVEDAIPELPQGLSFGSFLLERAGYYTKGNKDRRRQGLVRWKIMLRVRLRYLLALGPLRPNW